MSGIDWQDIHHLRAAEGWLGLGDYEEATAELKHLNPHLSTHPAVLRLRYAIQLAGKNWEMVAEITGMLLTISPEDPTGWLHHSEALHELHRTAEARDALKTAALLFPDHALIRYNLACYESHLGNLAGASDYLKQAFRLPEGGKLKLDAMADPDLLPLWQEIGSL
jgi:tetratricopeptide (TPR) repeat protein